jgi:hypothetical protein
MTFDPDRPETYPAWRAYDVLRVLAGMDFERRPTKFVRGSLTNVNHGIESNVFLCGCVASDDLGWQACKAGLHPILSKVSVKGKLVQRYEGLRKIFDEILAEAWRRKGGPSEHYAKFYESVQRPPFLDHNFKEWKRSQDLCQKSIWQGGELSACLNRVPSGMNISLSNGGNHKTPNIVMEYSKNDNRSISLPASSTEAFKIVFEGMPDRA